MKPLPTTTKGPREHHRARFLVPALSFFVAGAALSAVWFSHRGAENTAPVVSTTQAELSDATKAILQHLDSPVEIRFYSYLDATSVSDSVQAFSGRVDRLLAQYEQSAGGRIKVIRCNTPANFSADAAAADGIKAFNIDKGESCFLGIAVTCNGQKSALPHLATEWELALEPDLTRVIAAAIEANAATEFTVRADAATVDAVKRTIPDVAAVSLEEGTKVLRNAGLAQFMQAAEEIKAELADAQERLVHAQGSQAEAAAAALGKIQADGTEKLKQIAIASHAQIAALQQLKKASP